MPRCFVRLFQSLSDEIPARYPTARSGVLCAVCLASVLLAACGELEPMLEPEVVDLQLTTDTLKTSVRDAQRMVAELRADLDTRRKELAEAQVARAQLEGRVREAERRVIEARQVIELQREELSAARTEREHVLKSSLQLQNHMKKLQKQLSKKGKSTSGNDVEAAALPSGGALQTDRNAMQTVTQKNQPSEFAETPQMVSNPAVVRQMPVSHESSPEIQKQMAPAQHVSVQPGDTLWSIAKKYCVNVERLRAVNQLSGNRIVIGQALRLPDERTIPGAGSGNVMPTQ